MTETSKLGIFLLKPMHQAAIIAGLMIILSLLDLMLPHDDVFYESNAGPWIVSTSMILLFIVVNTVIALRIDNIMPYWISSILFFAAMLAFSYGWSYLLTGKQIDDVGSFRWIWIVLFLVYLVFFVIARSMKRIVDIAIKQDKKLRGEE